MKANYDVCRTSCDLMYSESMRQAEGNLESWRYNL